MSDVTKLPNKVTAQSILAEAKQEVLSQVADSARSKIKAKLTQIENAKQIVANLERELETLLEQVSIDLSK